MTCDVQSRGTIELYFYDELSPVERTGVQAHLLTCPACRQALSDLRLIRAALQHRPDVSAPAGGDWSGFMARLDRAIEASPAPARESTPPRSTGPSSPMRVAPYLAMAALLALATIGVVLAGRARTERAPSIQSVAEPAAVPAVATEPVRAAVTTLKPDAALVSLSGEHFQRSKLVLLGITTKEAAKVQGGDWAYERERAATLLGETRLYRQAAEQRGMDALAGVMRDLELVLLQTSMSDRPDTASLEQLQRLITRRDLLTKMDVYESGS